MQKYLLISLSAFFLAFLAIVLWQFGHENTPAKVAIAPLPADIMLLADPTSSNIEVNKTAKIVSNNLLDSLVYPPASATLEERTTGKVFVPMLDFTAIAEQTINTVVHIKTTSFRKARSFNPFSEFFNNPDEDGAEYEFGKGSGSGVILSENGYIVTNRHVVDHADDIQVILNDRRSYKAQVIATDTDTDIAVLKVNENGLPFIYYGDSDQLRVGEWVMAVGNPFNLASTVTTGIVSAKARNIGISEDNTAIESFIQTDAVVNPGNSGGALINMKGELVGINTAIATPTGYYAGYSFALPVNIVKKVVRDMLEFGEVQRGYLGVSIVNVDGQLAEKYGLDKVEGVWVAGVGNGSAAAEAGVQEGDVILKVQEMKTNSAAELQEVIGRYRPGDKVSMVLKRKNQLLNLSITLKKDRGN